MVRIGVVASAVFACGLVAGCAGGGTGQGESLPSSQKATPSVPAFPPAPTGKVAKIDRDGFPEAFQIIGVEQGPTLMGGTAPAKPGQTQIGVLFSVRPIAKDLPSPAPIRAGWDLLVKAPQSWCPLQFSKDGCSLTADSASPVYTEQQVRAPGGRNLLRPTDTFTDEGAQQLQPGGRYVVEAFWNDIPTRKKPSQMRICKTVDGKPCFALKDAPALPQR